MTNEIIYLAITPNGLQTALSYVETGAAVWCGADAMTDDDFNANTDPRVSRFTYPLKDAPTDVLADALATVREHHPEGMIWVEAKA
jgi:hypothetical protein